MNYDSYNIKLANRYFNLLEIWKLIVYLMIGGFLTLTASCQKEIELKVPEPAQRLVVDGSIAKGEFPLISLTKTSPFFSTIDSAAIVKLIVSTAKVTVSDGVNTEILTLKRDNSRFPPYYYEGTSIIGETGKTYTMRVDYQGKSYTSTTTIPSQISLDSVKFMPSDFFSAIGFLKISFRDPQNQSNYYRIFTKRLGKDIDYVPVYFSTFTDGGFNGQHFQMQISRGLTSTSSTEYNSLYYQVGDSVMIKFCTIDKENYDFWKYAETQTLIAKNPFAVSIGNPVTNISNGLGIWGGYGSLYYLYVIK